MTALAEIFSPDRNLDAALYEVRTRGSIAGVVAFLRGDSPISAADRAKLADLLEGKIKRPRGKPKKANAGALDRAKKLYNPINMGVFFARRYMRVFRRRQQQGRPIIPPGGMTSRTYAAKLACQLMERRSEGRISARWEAVEERMRRPRSRQG